MDAKQIYENLKEQFDEEILELDDTVKSPFIRIERESLLRVMRHLRETPELDFDCLHLVTGVDYPEHFTSVYHLYSYSKYHAIAIKADLPREAPEVDSVASIWPAADWHEREQYDLLGIVFRGHPNLRRIMCPEDWEGYPMRKDYVQPDEYHGISNVRQVGERSYPDAEEARNAIQQYKPPKPAPPKTPPAS